MSTSSLLMPCPQIQDDLNSYFTSCDPSLIRESLGVVEFFTSPANTSNTLQRQVSPGNGKKRQVELLYDQRLLESSVSDSVAKVCTSSNKYGEDFVTYDIPDDGVSIDWKIDPIDLEYHCKDDALYFAKQLQLKIDVLLRRMDTKLVNDLQSNIGGFATGDTNQDGTAIAGNVKVVSTKYSDGKINENLLVDVQYSAVNSAYCSSPILFGWGELWKYMRKFQAGCCSTQGIDLSQILAQNGAAVVGDYRIDAALGNAGYFISVAPGAFQVLTYNEFAGPKGIRMIDTEIYKQTVITDPATGISFDFLASLVCGVWNFQLKLAFIGVALPLDLFKVGDRLRGVNWINEFKITNP